MSQLTETVSAGPSSEAWEQHRPTIKRLYLDENRTLPQVMQFMMREYQFKASVKMYKTRLAAWNIDTKYLRRNEVKKIASLKVARDAVGKQSIFTKRGNEVKMQTVQRYLDKGGFSSLHDFSEAMSPVNSESGIEAHSPSLLSESNSHERICSGETDEDPHRHGTPRWAFSEHLNAISNAAVPISTNSLSLQWTAPFDPSERCISNLMMYLSGLPRSTDGGPSCVFISPVTIAISFLRQRDYVRARQMFSTACDRILKTFHRQLPTLSNDLLSLMDKFNSEGYPELTKLFMRYSFAAACEVLGNQHPLTQIVQYMKAKTQWDVDFKSKFLQCYVDALAKRLGKWHLDVLDIRMSFVQYLPSEEALVWYRKILLDCEQQLSKADRVWYYVKLSIALALVKSGSIEEAEAHMRHLRFSQGTDEHTLSICHTYLILSKTRYDQRDFAGAEYYARLAADLALTTYDSGGAFIISLQLYRVRLLRGLQKDDEAQQIEKQIQDVLGSPVIEELL